MLPKLRPIVTEIMDQFNQGAAKAGKKEGMWTEASKYCDVVNGRRDVRVVPLSYQIHPLELAMQVVIAVEFDLDQELQKGTAPRFCLSRDV